MKNKVRKGTRNIFRKFVNRYTSVGLLFIVWIAILDKYSFIEQFKLGDKIRALEREKCYYTTKIEDDKRKKEELSGTKEDLEKFAREHFLMKNEDEEIFIIVDD